MSDHLRIFYQFTFLLILYPLLGSAQVISKESKDLFIVGSESIIFKSAINNKDYKLYVNLPENLKYLTLGLSAFSTYDPSSGALNNLVSSGQLNLIKNDSLRIILSKWSGEVQDVKEDEVRMMKYGDTYLEPIRLQHLIYNPDSQFHRNSIALLENPEFENILVRFSRGVDYIIKNYESLGLEIENILIQIDQEIK